MSYDVAVAGLGVMGASLARNFASRSLDVVGYNRTVERARALAAEHPEARLGVAESIEAMVRMLSRPRRIVLMLSAGDAVDAMIAALDPLLEQGDVIVDAGNSLFRDTERRLARAKGRPWSFVGMGVSGGEEGALRGPSIMPGGAPEAYERLRPLLEAIAAKSEHGPCVTWCGHGSAGHFVKMVHNGIEYGDMQLIAETAVLLRDGVGLDLPALAATFAAWNEGELGSYLIEITAEVLRARDPEGPPGARLVDAILDRAGQKGTGRWTLEAALELGVAVPTIAAAVDARMMSAQRELRVRAAGVLRHQSHGLDGVAADELRDALYAAKIASYTQGFALLRTQSELCGYETNLAEVARIWTAGCIIRARFLGRIMEAFRGAAPELLALAPDFSSELGRRLPSLRRVVAAASSAGFAIPAFAASLAWLETLTTARGSAWLIQAQRDYFGAHTYERVDRPGVAVHSDWRALLD